MKNTFKSISAWQSQSLETGQTVGSKMILCENLPKQGVINEEVEQLVPQVLQSGILRKQETQPYSLDRPLWVR